MTTIMRTSKIAHATPRTSAGEKKWTTMPERDACTDIVRNRVGRQECSPLWGQRVEAVRGVNERHDLVLSSQVIYMVERATNAKKTHVSVVLQANAEVDVVWKLVSVRGVEKAT